jgi:hypothetical protein
LIIFEYHKTKTGFIMKKIGIFCIILISVFSLQAQETIPPYHWTWNYMNYLKTNGYFESLDLTNRPLYRDQVAEALIKIDFKNIPGHTISKKMISVLIEEFKYEIKELGKTSESNKTDSTQNYPKKMALRIGAFGKVDYTNENPDFEKRAEYSVHPQAGLKFGKNFYLYGNIKIFNKADSNYIGKKYRDHYGYMEQGYFLYKSQYLNIKIGRDFLQTGPGRSSQLLISDNSRPFNMYHVRLGNSFINLTFWGIQLNKRDNVDTLLIQYSPYTNRFLNGHRLSFNIKKKYYFGINEVVIYGGPNAIWEIGFMNPFGVYYGHNVNDTKIKSNLLYSIDFDLYLPHNLRLYGDILIDDFQFDKKVSGDLEPNEVGLLAGIDWANPLRLAGGLFHFEYVQIRNRTYNAPENDWEKYLHRNKVIGYYLGNDFKLFRTSMEKWWRGDLNTKIFVHHVRKGEGTVQGEFNKDYLDYPVEDGYKESFPWGIVETHWQYGLQIFYRPITYSNISVNLAYNDFKNYRNEEGENKTEFSFTVSLWLQWNHGWIFQDRIN